MSAFRMAYHPPRLVEDLRVLPALVMSKAFLIPTAMVVGGGLLLLTPMRDEPLIRIFIGAVVFAPPAAAVPAGITASYAPPLIAPFLAGFLATRASYLIGALVGVMTVIMFAIFVVVEPQSVTGVSDVPLAIGQALLGGVPFAIVFASFAAYYKRLLRIWTPRQDQQGRRKR